MKTSIEQNIEIVDIALKSMKKIGIDPIIVPIRGETDGTNLSNCGLPCPNLGSAGHNFHITSEYITLEYMEKVRDILISIVK